MYLKLDSIQVDKQLIRFAPDDTRVITKLFSPGNNERIQKIINRVLGLNDEKLLEILEQTLRNFSNRHKDIKRIFKDNFDRIINETDIPVVLKESLSDLPLNKKLLIGSYFTMEYSIESAALFNPSIVEHPDQGILKKGRKRVIISFRAVGEGHLSSIVFRKGIIKENGNITLDKDSALVEDGNIIPNYTYNKKNFILKLKEISKYDLVKEILDELLDVFNDDELKESIKIFKKKNNHLSQEHHQAIETLLWLADSTYEVQFNKDLSLSGRVIFPRSRTEINGLEDARFVVFREDDGTKKYYATYAAYDGHTILPQLIETDDFVHFRISTLIGSGSQNKGMALFPEKINGKYAIISRNDNENLFIMFSDNIRYWENPVQIRIPTFYWEFFQIGNCGSPIKTNKGWLLLTHGVGPVRTYCIGALLLDLKNPTKVIAQLEDPLLFPYEKERDGYVPNVVYSCGAIIHKSYLVVPYAMSDTRSGIAKINLNTILNSMTPAK